ncbi:MAG: hypothetical protein IT292_10715 [Deltaproteobacteria bacterium]|nr:hypothetical protein [Deltaproteobacteria bacterium]
MGSDFPEHIEFRELVAAAPNWGKIDLQKKRLGIVEAEFDDGYFDNAKISAERGRVAVTSAFETFGFLARNWGFNFCENYVVRLYRYEYYAGYFENECVGLVLMGCRRSEEFSPANFATRAIHEMVHIGIEEKIVRKYNLTHWQKGCVVDNICKKAFGSLLPAYKYQMLKDESFALIIDEYLSESAINCGLPVAIEQYLAATKVGSICGKSAKIR